MFFSAIWHEKCLNRTCVYTDLRDASGRVGKTSSGTSHDNWNSLRSSGLIKRLIYFCGMQGYAQVAKTCNHGESWSPPKGRALMNSDVRCYECSVRRIIRLSVPFSGTAVKHGKLPVSISSIRDEKSKIWLRLILPAATAIGIRLRHASRESSGLGGLLSNTWRTCP